MGRLWSRQHIKRIPNRKVAAIETNEASHIARVRGLESPGFMEDTPADVEDKVVSTGRLENIVLPACLDVGSNPHSVVEKHDETYR